MAESKANGLNIIRTAKLLNLKATIPITDQRVFIQDITATVKFQNKAHLVKMGIKVR
jgi:hypothetical protein